jgi:hypothetical protein
MSSMRKAPMIETRLCRHCQERPAQPGALRWYSPSGFISLLFGIGPARNGWCEECAGGLNLLGLLAWIGVAVIALVMVVVSL